MQLGTRDADDDWFADRHSQSPRQDNRISTASVDFEFAASSDEGNSVIRSQSPAAPRSNLGIPAARIQPRKPRSPATHNKGPRHSSPDIIAITQVQHNASSRFSVPNASADHISPIARAKNRISEDNFDAANTQADQPASTDPATRVKGSDSGVSDEKARIVLSSQDVQGSNSSRSSEGPQSSGAQSLGADQSPIPSPNLPRFRQTKLSLVASANSTML